MFLTTLPSVFLPSAGGVPATSLKVHNNSPSKDGTLQEIQVEQKQSPHCAARDDLRLLIVKLPAPECWTDMHHHTQVEVLGIKPRSLCMLGELSVMWAHPPPHRLSVLFLADPTRRKVPFPTSDGHPPT